MIDNRSSCMLAICPRILEKAKEEEKERLVKMPTSCELLVPLIFITLPIGKRDQLSMDLR
jgi:hypothetical protein